MGEGTGEFGPGEWREPPYPAAPFQHLREETLAPAVRDAFRPPGAREPPLRHATHRLLDYVPLDVACDPVHGETREGMAPPTQSPAATRGGAQQAAPRYYSQPEGTAGQRTGRGEGGGRGLQGKG